MLHLVIAGNADPAAVRRLVDDELKQALLDLHRSGASTDLRRLQEIGLAIGNMPGIFVAGKREAIRIADQAVAVGRELAAAIDARWDELETLFARLDVARSRSFRDLAFLFVGDFVLDVGLLDTLAADASLMPPAPERTLGPLATSRYYLWLIEGQPELLGQYGQRQVGLPWDGWVLTTFGQYFVEGAPNTRRLQLIEEVSHSSRRAESAAGLAGKFDLPLIPAADMNRWRHGISDLLADLVQVYKRNERSIREIHVEISGGSDRTFGEFFCWYDHLAYAHAIDALVAMGRFALPEQRFFAAILQPWDVPGAFSSS